MALVALCFVSISSAQVTGPPSGTAQEILIDSGEVTAVRFEGNDAMSDYELSTIVNTRTSTWIERTLNSIVPSLGAGRQYADRVVLDQDVENLNAYYKANGYMEVQSAWQQRYNREDLDAYIKVLNQNRTAPREYRQKLPRVRDTVIFWISEGPVYNIAGVSFEGMEALPEEFQPELTERNTIKVGQRWSSRTAESEIARLQSILGENGYPFFKKDSIVLDVLVETNEVRVLPYITPGPRYRFGEVRIVYDSTREDSRVSERVVKGQLSLDSGAWYKESLVRESEQYLFRLNTFENVSIYLDTNVAAKVPPHMRDSLALPVIVHLRMKGTQELQPGVFMGTGSIGLSGGFTVGYNNRNIFGGAQNFHFNGFYQLLPRWQPRISAIAELTIPYLGWRNVPLILGANYITTRQFNKNDRSQLQYVDDNYRLRASSNIVIGHPDNRTSVSPEVTFEYVQTENHLNDIENDIRKQVNTIVATYGQWDRSNDIFNPSEGFILNGGAEVGLPLLQGLAPADFASASYYKGIAQGRIYKDLTEIGALIFAGKLRGGYTKLLHPEDPLKDVPIERRFFAGGSSSIRGWGSKELLISRDPKRNPTINGGYELIETSLEFRIAPIKPSIDDGDLTKVLTPLRFVAFVDAGNAWDYGVKFGINQVALAAGPGIRYNTFIGVFRLDWGLKIYDPNPTYTKDEPRAAPPDTRGKWIFQRRVAFFAKEPDDVWTLHFGLTHAF